MEGGPGRPAALRGRVCWEGRRMNALLEDQGGKELEPGISGELRGAGKCRRWGESAQSQGNKGEPVWAQTGWMAGPPQRHTRTWVQLVVTGWG